MNGALDFAINIMMLSVGVVGAVVASYVGYKILRAIKDGQLIAHHLVADKGTNAFSLHKTGQIVGMVALTVAFIYIVKHAKLEDANVGEWMHWLFGVYGSIMILPQAWVNFLNKDKPAPPAPNGTKP